MIYKKNNHKSIDINFKTNVIYVKLLFKYRNMKLNLSNVPNIDFIKNILSNLPENMHNDDMVDILYKSLDKNKENMINSLEQIEYKKITMNLSELSEDKELFSGMKVKENTMNLSNKDKKLFSNTIKLLENINSKKILPIINKSNNYTDRKDK